MSHPNELLRKDGLAEINGLQDAHTAKLAFSGPNENTLTDRYGAGVDSAGWRPIETAPKDGKRVLITGGTCEWGFYPPSPFDGVTIASFDMAAHGTATHPWQGDQLDGHDEFMWHAPTHWMPLPAPPLPTPGGSDE